MPVPAKAKAVLDKTGGILEAVGRALSFLKPSLAQFGMGAVLFFVLIITLIATTPKSECEFPIGTTEGICMTTTILGLPFWPSVIILYTASYIVSALLIFLYEKYLDKSQIKGL